MPYASCFPLTRLISAIIGAYVARQSSLSDFGLDPCLGSTEPAVLQEAALGSGVDAGVHGHAGKVT